MHNSPKWDGRFLGLARSVSEWSRDPSSRIGAVIVRPDKTVASLGFNGFARGLPDDPDLYADRDFKIATVLHAEENAILSSHDQSLKSCTIYVSGLPPCASCASKIIQVGITRVVAYNKLVPERWVKNMTWAADNLLAAGVEVTVYDEADDEWTTIEVASDLMMEQPAEIQTCDATCGCSG